MTFLEALYAAFCVVTVLGLLFLLYRWQQY